MLVEIATGVPLFSGESDIDQLWLIIKCFGTVSPGHRAFMAANPVRTLIEWNMRDGALRPTTLLSWNMHWTKCWASSKLR